ISAMSQSSEHHCSAIAGPARRNSLRQRLGPRSAARLVRRGPVRMSSQARATRSLGALPDLPLERIVVPGAELRIRIPFHLDLELKRLLDEPGRVLVGVLDGLRVGVTVERVRAAVVEDDLAGLRVGLGDAPVPPRAELEATAGLGRVADLVGG